MFFKRGLIYLAVLTLILAFSFNVFAGVTGKITGRVIDKQTKEGIPGVNVIVPELGIGAATDLDGYYFILNVPVGEYSVQAQIISYQTQTKSGVSVSADINTTVNFDLSLGAIEYDTVIVEAKESKIQTNVTQKERTMNQELLNEAVSSNIMAAVANNAGVVGSGNNLHVRGGRTDEVGYMVDGMSIVDPVTKGLGATINKNAVSEVKFISGGFNAEYGEAMSGVLNIVTREGAGKYEGTVKYEGNSFLPSAFNYGDNRIELSLGGPIYKDKARFFFSGDVYTTNDWSPMFITTPDFIYVNDSNDIAFEYDLYDYVLNYDSTGAYLDSVPSHITYNDDSVPYFTYDLDTVFDSTGAIYGIYNRVIVDTVLWNRYGPSYWENLGIVAPHHKRHEYHGQAKFTFKPTNNIKLNIGGFVSHSSYQQFNNDLKYNLERFVSRNTDGYQLNSTMNWMFNQSNFITLTASYFHTQTYLGPEFDDTIITTVGKTLNPPETIIPEWYAVWQPYGIMDTTAFKNLPSINDKWASNSPWGWWNDPQLIYPNWYGSASYRYSNYLALKGDWTSQVGRYHEVKSGIEYKAYELYLWDLYLPWSPNPFADYYHVYPQQIAAYVQDKMEFEGMVVNLGIRLDYLDANTPYYSDATNRNFPLYKDTVINEDTVLVPNIVKPATPLEGYTQADWDSLVWPISMASKKYKVSPRLGISHPISETSVLHFNYGHFFQTPQMDYLFTGLGIDFSKRGNSNIGSPNLEAERTVSYEFGIATQVGADMAIDFTTYYKDIYGLIGSRKVYALPSAYYALQNVEYGNVKGFEVAFSKSSKYFSTDIAYTLSFAKGTASDAWDGYYDTYSQRDPVTGGDVIMPKIPYYLDFDQRHTINVGFVFRMPAKELPIYADNWTIAVDNAISSGQPYTPVNEKGVKTGVTNSERKPWSFNTDMKFRKGFLFGTFEPNLYISVFNVLNIKNVVDVYASTGLPDRNAAIGSYSVTDFPTNHIGEPGYDVRRDTNQDGTVTPQEYYDVFIAAYTDYLNDPTNYSTPRTVTVGIEFSF
ncbi:MAG: carboxypeptidase-like regulatory domain-containing protein [bacterium]